MNPQYRAYITLFLVGSANKAVRQLTLSSLDPSLMQPLLPTLFKGALMSVGVVAGMFGLTYLPQVAVLALISGPLGKIFPYL